jgi:hypothetical protein
MYESHVVVSRLGEVKLPVDVLIKFDNDDYVREHWDGQDRWVDFKYVKPARIVWAKVDPDDALAIDIDKNNNSKTTEPSASGIWKYVVKFLFWVQNILQSVAIFG